MARYEKLRKRRRIQCKKQVKIDLYIGKVRKITWYFGTKENKEETEPADDKPPPPEEGPAVCPLCGTSQHVICRGNRKTKRRGKIRRYQCKIHKLRFVQTPYARTRFPNWVVDQVLDLMIEGLPLTRIARKVAAEAKRRKKNFTISRKSIANIVRRNVQILLDFELCTRHEAAFSSWQIDDTPQRYSGRKEMIKLGNYDNSQSQAEPKKDWNFAWITNIIDEESRYWLVCIASEGRSYRESEKAVRVALKITRCSPFLIKCDGYKGHVKGIRKVLKQVRILSVPKSVDFDFINIIEALHKSMRSLAVKKRRKYRLLGTLCYSVELTRIYYNFLRPHLSLNGETPAKKAGVKYPYHEGLTWSEFIRFAFEYLRKRRKPWFFDSEAL